MPVGVELHMTRGIIVRALCMKRTRSAGRRGVAGVPVWSTRRRIPLFMPVLFERTATHAWDFQESRACFVSKVESHEKRN